MLRKFKKLPRYQQIIIGIILFVVILLILKNGKDADITTYEVTQTDVVDTIQLAGVVDVDQRVDLGFASSGRVSDVYVREGETVKKGQVIARIDQNQLEASLLQARANQVVTTVDASSSASGAVGDYETTKRQQDTLVAGAYETYLSGDLAAYYADDTSKNVVAPTISGSYTGTEEGEYIIDVYGSSTTSGFSFTYNGLEQGTTSAEVYLPGQLGTKGLFIQFDEDSNYRNTRWIVPVPNTRSATYTSRKASYENALATREQVLHDAEIEYSRVTGTSSSISRTDALQQQAQAQVSAVYAQLNDGKIVAPFDGIVARNDLEIGQIVSAYTGVITLFGSNDRQLELNVPEIYINKVELGDTVNITLDAYPNEMFQGTVEDIDIIDTVVDGVPVYLTTVVFVNDDDRIRVGMNAKAVITSDSRIDVVAIPVHYLTTEGDTTSVTVDQNGTLTLLPVETGFEGNDGMIEILSGLNVGDTIIRPL